MKEGAVIDVTEAIMTRRSVRRFTSTAISQEQVAQLLRYAPWVPNHHVSEPWRYVVVGQDSLKTLARLRHDAVMKKRQGQPQAESRAARAEQEFLEAQWVIAAISHLDQNPVRRSEDAQAMALSIYNILLAAWNQGIASYWNTGPLIEDPHTAQWLELADDERAFAFIRLGYPESLGSTVRTPIEERVVWRT